MLQYWLEIARGVALQIDSPNVAIFWGYLAGAAVIAAIVYLRRRPDARIGLRGFLRFVFPPHAAWRRAWHDVAVFAINTAAYSVWFLATVQLVSSTVGSHVWLWLHGAFGPVADPWTSTAARAGMTLAILVVSDLAFYGSHRLQHRVSWLWEFHKIHHSAQVLHPFTVARRHPVDVIVETMILAASLGALYGVTGWLSGGALDGYRILGVNAVLFFFLLVFNLQHSHVWLSYGPLDWVFISPATHQLHHSRDPRHFGNYGNVFAIWDFVFGTLVRPRDASGPQVGLPGGQDREYTSLVRLCSCRPTRS